MTARQSRLWTVAIVAALAAADLRAAGPVFVRPTAAPASAVDARPVRDRLVVHEWGTFTVLQDERGNGLGGINVDDEPLPEFVHSLYRYSPTRSHSLGGAYESKGAPQRHPYVRMRLETPVMYFYPPTGAAKPLQLDVSVQFRGGLLTQHYPAAEVVAPGIDRQGRPQQISGSNRASGSVRPDTVGELHWRNLQVGTAGTVPLTDSPVWLAPRVPDAATVTAESGESERYLFYRGIANIEAPLRVSGGANSAEFVVRGNLGNVVAENESISIGPLWIVHILDDGRCAYRQLSPAQAGTDAGAEIARFRPDFAAGDFAGANLHKLCAEMHAALVADGLYDAEATGLLETWRAAYFKSPGLRLFFLVPQAWTDGVLPLAISQPAQIRRVMVARVELISPQQRTLLGRLRTQPVSDLAWLDQVFRSPQAERFFQDRSSFRDPNVRVPADYQTYLDMGRFRNALVRNEAEVRPSPSLHDFIRAYGLEGYSLADATDR